MTDQSTTVKLTVVDWYAQAACPQFEAQIISKAAISVPEPPIDEEELVNAWYIRSNSSKDQSS